MQFPRLVYKSASSHMLVDDSHDFDAAILAGWFETVPDAIAAKLTPVVLPDVKHDDNVPPTRAKLETKAKELGVKFDGRTNDVKLGKMITEALQA